MLTCFEQQIHVVKPVWVDAWTGVGHARVGMWLAVRLHYELARLLSGHRKG